MRVRWAVIWALVCCCCVLNLQAIDLASLKAKAESGDAKAQVALAQAYEQGEGVPQNSDLAAKWMRAAAEKGDPQAQNELGVFYRRGIGVEQDKAQAFQWYAKSAAQGYAPARFNLAACYYNGDGTGIVDSLAYVWFRLAAASGSKEAAEAVTRMEAELSPTHLDAAKLTLADILAEGRQTPKDAAGALKLRSEVAAHSDREALFSLGRMYAEGIGTSQNGALAIKYLTASATPSALTYMADMYFEGRGVPREPRKGLELLEQAANFDPIDTRLRLAELYWKSGGGPQDYKKAMTHYTAAARAGDPTALYMSGIGYRDGLGVKRNEAMACMFFVLAANFKSEEASKIVQQECPGQKLEAAKKKAADFIGSHRLKLQLEKVRGR